MAYILSQVSGQPSLFLQIKPSVSKTSAMQEARSTCCLPCKGRQHLGFVCEGWCSYVPCAVPMRSTRHMLQSFFWWSFRREIVSTCSQCSTKALSQSRNP